MVLLSDKHPIDLTIGQELPPTFHYAWVILRAAASNFNSYWDIPLIDAVQPEPRLWRPRNGYDPVTALTELAATVAGMFP